MQLKWRNEGFSCELLRKIINELGQSVGTTVNRNYCKKVMKKEI